MCFRQQLTVEPQKCISTHLEKNTCQQHVNWCSCLTMSIRQPCMNWYNREFDAKGNQESCIAPELEVLWESLLHQSGVLKVGSTTTCPESHRQSSNKNEQRTSCSVDNELRSSILAIFTSPDCNHEIHRNKFQFPRQEEQDQILNCKDHNLTTCHQKQQEVEQFRFECNWPSSKCCQTCNKTCQQNEGH